MPTQTRATLKGYFTKGSIPTENNFADLIDSTLVQIDDGLLASATAPFSIKAVGADEGLINFYRVESGQKPNTTTWQIKHLPVGSSTPGLSIGTPAATRLFIDNTTGNVGIGTVTPGFPLTIGNNTLGDKISLWGQSGNHYGFGIQGYQLQIHTAAASDDVVFGYGSSGSMTETMRIKGTGDVALLGKHALRASDTWLRLNQDGAFSSGVHTPGVLAPMSLNVGGAGGWGNPGGGNVWITGNVGIGTVTPGFPLTIGNNTLGDKISLWGQSGNHYGFGIQGAQLQIHTAAASDDVVFGYGSSGSMTETMRIKGTGNVKIAGSLMQQDWQAVAFQNGWHNYAGGYNDAGYFKDSMGIVHLRGLVAGGGLNTIFVLPTGYRPGARQLFVCSTNPNVAGRVDVTTAGEVTVVTGNSGWLSLDGLTFRAESGLHIGPIIDVGPIINPGPVHG